ncbi:MAG: EamA family transporter [bacterium]|nr:EamA family transporter [bacterium]
MSGKRILPTILGMAALVFWSSSVAFTRSVTEHMGTLHTAFFNLLFSGLILLTAQAFIYRGQLLPKITGLPFSYYTRVGSFMVLYMVLFYIAIGRAGSREAVIVVGIINYLWPGFTFLFSVAILKHKSKYILLFTGIAVAFAGTAAALLEGNSLSLSSLASTIRENLIPYVAALAAAVAWGLYSNLARKYKTKHDVVSVPLFFIISSFFILIILLVKGETPRLLLSGGQYAEFLYLVIFPTALAYLFWNIAMKEGNKNLVTAGSYLVPLASTLVNGIYLKVTIGPGFWGAAVLVLAGAVLCRFSIQE